MNVKRKPMIRAENPIAKALSANPRRAAVLNPPRKGAGSYRRRSRSNKMEG